jgi:hypothetical protein
MFGLFGPKLPVDEDELEFQLATLKWLQAEFGEVGQALILPTPAFFPPSPRKGHGRIEDLFHHVKSAAQMLDWPCELRAGAQDRPVQIGAALLLRHEGAPAPCGTFQVQAADGTQKVVITYNPALADDPDALIATLAHELAHYLMSTARSDPPGGWELHELHTDLAAVYIGFGLFLANSARSFAQFSDGSVSGWSARTQGYLSEGALVTALAVVERLAGRDPADAAPWLKDYLRKDLARSAKALARRFPDMRETVGAIDLAAFG